MVPVNNAIIKVAGVGGAGCNAVDRMVEAGISGVEFIALNTDLQVLDQSKAEKKIQLGPNVSRGLGAGGDPEVGRESAEETKNEIRKALEGSDMVFITAGMGGGTGTGAAAVIADVARELGALAVAIITKPFRFEGARRTRLADGGVQSLVGRVDTLIVIPNDRLLDVVERKTSFVDAFRVADDVLRQGVQGISDIITVPGMINVDFADVKSVMANAGPALMGIGYGMGEHRALQAAQQATSSPLLEQTIHGAQGLLVNITSGEDLTLTEVNEAMEFVHSLCDANDANIIFGTVLDSSLQDEVRITVLATGFSGTGSGKPSAVKAASATPSHAVAQAPDPVPAPQEPTNESKAANYTPRNVVKDVWNKVSSAPREKEAPEPEEIFDESEIDIPAFLREHRRRRED